MKINGNIQIGNSSKTFNDVANLFNEINSLFNEIDDLNDKIGNLNDLDTSTKSNIVNSINELLGKFGDLGIHSKSLGNNGYIRFNNGLQIAWRYLSTSGGGTPWGYLYYSDHSMGNWNASFKNLYFFTPVTNSLMYWCTVGSTSASSAGTARVFRPTSGVTTIIIRVIGFGTWK